MSATVTIILIVVVLLVLAAVAVVAVPALRRRRLQQTFGPSTTVWSPTPATAPRRSAS